MFKKLLFLFILALQLSANIELLEEQKQKLLNLYEINDVNYSYKNYIEITPFIEDKEDLKSNLIYIYKDQMKSLIIFTQPKNMEEKVVLSIDKNKWLYSPKVSKAIRIASSSSLYGDVSVEDILKYSLEKDYELKEIEGKDNITIFTFTGVKDGLYFFKKVIEYDNNLKKINKVHNFSRSNFLLNSVEYSKSSDGNEVYKIINTLNKKKYTFVKFLPKEKLDNIDEKYFQSSNLNLVYKWFIKND